MKFTKVGYDPIAQKVYVGSLRENERHASFAARASGMDCTYEKVFNIADAQFVDYVEFFQRCGVTKSEAAELTSQVTESILESLKGLPLTHAVYARRLDGIL
jgi:hypothetical protein